MIVELFLALLAISIAPAEAQTVSFSIILCLNF